jgi:hypothetical protein
MSAQLKTEPQARKWISEAGPRQTKQVNEALNKLATEHNTFTEKIGVIGVNESSYDLYSPFGGASRADVSKVQQKIAERFDYTVTRQNYQDIITAVSQALPILRANRPVRDKRRTREEDTERDVEMETKRQTAQEGDVADQAHAVEVARIEQELREKYPWARKDEALSRQAQAAANLRAELALTFPGVKFKVTSDSASMTNSVRYEWTLGPDGNQVSTIADKYAYGRFDPMQDLSTSDNSAFGEAVERVLGRAKYVSGSRAIPEAIREQIGRLLCEAQQVEYQGDWTPHVFGQGDTRQLLDHVTEILSRTTFPPHQEIASLVWKECGYDEVTGEDVQHSGYYLTFNSKNICPMCKGEAGEICCEINLESKGITVTENVAKVGIEIRFDPKPSQDVLDLIHAQGHGVWRWHKKGRFWYAKANDSTRAFAQSLLGGGGANA